MHTAFPWTFYGVSRASIPKGHGGWSWHSYAEAVTKSNSISRGEDTDPIISHTVERTHGMEVLLYSSLENSIPHTLKYITEISGSHSKATNQFLVIINLINCLTTW